MIVKVRQDYKHAKSIENAKNGKSMVQVAKHSITYNNHKLNDVHLSELFPPVINFANFTLLQDLLQELIAIHDDVDHGIHGLERDHGSDGGDEIGPVSKESDGAVVRDVHYGDLLILVSEDMEHCVNQLIELGQPEDLQAMSQQTFLLLH